ncbi:MAG: putative toxin-antitoxin system toxin component, PIN family [Nitrospirae bacterium]|nr:putative toxin-antitoxin system toxin component, PIN family [Nitrospirota bacterium]MBI3352132.1 putative toxin-antitoxin system toxin component, PIN family [Nitrospirota bacterium]
MPVRAVIDTNIWVSALLNPFGFPARLRKAFEEGAFHAVVSEPIIKEISDVLSRPRIKSRYGVSEHNVQELLILIEERSEHVLLSGDIDICRDKDDDLIIETAVKGKAGYLVTRDDDIKFDKDVSAYLSKYDISVLSVAKFLNLLGLKEPSKK